MKLFALSLVATLFVGPFPALARAAEPISAAVPAPIAEKKIKLATLAPKGSSFHKILLAMGDRWKSAPDGGVAVTIYPDGAMGGEADVVRRMRAGQLQASLLTVTGLKEIDPSVSAFQNLPMLFRSLDEAAAVRAKLASKIDARLAEKGFVILFWGDVGWVRFFSKQPILVPADAQRAKLFTWSGSSEQIDLMKSLDWKPVALETADILPSLQTGLIDAVPTLPFYALAGQFFSTANHMLELDWAPLVGALVVTKKSWDALSDGQREALRTSALEASKQIGARNRIENDESVEAMKKRGLVVHVPTAAQVDEWRTLLASVHPKFRGTIVPADVFDDVHQALSEIRASGTR